MDKVPSLPYTEILRALQRDGWVTVRQRGSHIRLQKHTGEETMQVDRASPSSGQALHS